MIARGKQPRAFLLGARRMSVGGLFRRIRSTRMRVPGAWVSERSGAARRSLRVTRIAGEKCGAQACSELTRAVCLGNIVGCRFLASLFDNRD